MVSADTKGLKSVQNQTYSRQMDMFLSCLDECQLLVRARESNQTGVEEGKKERRKMDKMAL